MSQQVHANDQANLLLTDDVDKLQKVLHDQEITLTEQTHALKQLTHLSQEHEWRLHQIKYLINLADTSLSFGHDIPETIRLLTQAHHLILETHDPALTVLDQSIEDNRKTLAGIKIPDISLLFLKLHELEQSIDNMPFLGAGFIEENTPEEEISTTNNWRDHLKKTWKQLRQLITVKKTPNALIPLVAQEQGEYINQYLHMQIGQAQWALLHHNTTIYESSLTQAIEWINRYYTVLNPKTQEVLMVLQELKTRKYPYSYVTAQ
ncbi:MAG: uroporphyrinogen-III C-methyltransferase [Gammaproteobacteria bacterium]|nr:uroporphyrinogen-III C-methyltransferase [Gammaproteobacteria bacterium]